MRDKRTPKDVCGEAKIKCPLFVLEKVRIIEVFFKKENVRILSGHWKLSLI